MQRDLARASRTMAAVLGGVVTGIGTTALLGWLTDSELLRTSFWGNINIKTNTAISVMCLGLALILASQRRAVLAMRVLAGLPIVVGTLTFVQHVTGADFGIDQLLFAEPPGAAATASPNRMGPPASISFPLLGLALLMIDRPGRRRPPAQLLALAVVIISTGSVLGYIFGVEQLYGLARYTGIALNTAISLLMLGIGVFLAQPECGATRRLLADDAGGVLLRRLLPATVALPVVLGLLKVAGENAGWYDESFGRSLLILSFILVFSMVTWRTGSAVQRHAAARAAAEAAERSMHASLMTALDRERAARGMAERSNRMKDEFLATLSHELRTPLGAMLGWAELLLRGDLSDRDERRGLEAIERNARLQASLIEELLDMSRIDSGKVTLDMREVDLALLIESVVAAASPAAQAGGITLQRELASPMPRLRGDAARLQQVLSNLLSNAIKFTPPGGRVTLSVSSTETGVRIAVTDTGRGISRDFLPHVFDRFRQADASTTRRFGGLGLGLAIARQLVEMHDGTLVADSDGVDHGATFVVTLPRAASTLVEPARTAAEVGPLASAKSRLAGVRVLVVDDYPETCELVARILHECGAVVSSAGGVSEAVARLSREPVDVIVSDISMPEQDGFDLIRHVRERMPTLPAVALTALARPEDAQQILSAGFHRHLSKPILSEPLIQAVASVLPTHPSPAPPA